VEFELSAKDTEAPTLAEAEEQGLLPTMEECAARYAELRQIAR
jgi:dTDP-4-dehydrorhamnose 3,5-epimerase